MDSKSIQTPLTQRVFEVYQALKKVGIVKNQTDFAQRTGMLVTHWHGYQTGRRRANERHAQALVSQFGVSYKYIMEGEGPMFDSSESHNGVMAATRGDLIVRSGPDTPRPIYKGPLNALPVPLVTAKVQAGFAESFLDDTAREELDIYPYIYITDEPDLKDPWAFEVRGESMEPTLHRGNIVVATPVPDGNVQHVSGGLFVLVYAIDGYADLVVKRIKTNELSSGGTVTLHSDNPIGGNLTLRRADIRAMWKVRRAVIEF